MFYGTLMSYSRRNSISKYPFTIYASWLFSNQISGVRTAFQTFLTFSKEILDCFPTVFDLWVCCEVKYAFSEAIRKRNPRMIYEIIVLRADYRKPLLESARKVYPLVLKELLEENNLKLFQVPSQQKIFLLINF